MPLYLWNPPYMIILSFNNGGLMVGRKIIPVSKGWVFHIVKAPLTVVPNVCIFNIQTFFQEAVSYRRSSIRMDLDGICGPGPRSAWWTVLHWKPRLRSCLHPCFNAVVYIVYACAVSGTRSSATQPARRVWRARQGVLVAQDFAREAIPHSTFVHDASWC